MTLVDTSVWIDHLRKPVEDLVLLLRERQVLTHSAVIGELACGRIPKRDVVLSDLVLLPKATEAADEEVLRLIDTRELYGKGLGWVDMQLLASALISGSSLFTRDKRLAKIFATVSSP